jgi:Flp pilus assembly protein TadD
MRIYGTCFAKSSMRRAEMSQLAAISYLGALQYAPAAGFLGEMYEDPDTGQAIREALLRALGSIRDPETADLIFDLASR